MLLLQPAVVVSGILVTQLRGFSVFLFSIVPQRNVVRMLRSGHALFLNMWISKLCNILKAIILCVRCLKL